LEGVFVLLPVVEFQFIVSKGSKYILILENKELKFYHWEKYKNAFQQRFPVSTDQPIRVVRNLESEHKKIESLSFGNGDFLDRIIVTNERTILFGIGNRIIEYSVDKWNTVNNVFFANNVMDFEYDLIEKKSFTL